ncbi:MAG: sugar ABC transporter substrate-binding protein [Chloroflexota bacterium]
MIFLLLTLFLTLSVVMAQDTAAIEPESCKEPGEVTMWVWDANWAKIINASIADWEVKYCKGAKVNLQVQPWDDYWKLLHQGATDGNLPDVFNMTQDRFLYYAGNDSLLDLQPLWDNAGVDTQVWQPAMTQTYRWGKDSDLYAGPVNWDTVAVYYNKDMFDAAALSYPRPDWDWNNFAMDAAALTNPAKHVYGAAVYAEYQSGYSNWIASTGTPPILGAGRTQCTLTVTPSLNALNFLKGLYDKGYMPSVTIMGGSSADNTFSFWLNGQVAMITGGSWKLPEALSDVPFNWDVVQLPRNPETGRSRSILHSVGYVASANTKAPDLAANLILYLVSDEGQQFFADAGGVAPANPTLQQQWIDSFGKTSVNIKAFVDAQQDSQGVTIFDEIIDAVNTDLVVDIFDKGMGVDEAAAKTCDFVNAHLPGNS